MATGENLIEERQRLEGGRSPRVPCDDWALLMSHYLNSDLLVAGMPKADLDLILNGNARRIFRLAQKLEALKTAPWIK